MASYVLIVIGGTKIQLRESLKYIVFNIISSALFVIGVAYLYAVTGTLNMADLSVRISESGQTGLITVIAVLFLIVFGLKAASSRCISGCLVPIMRRQPLFPHCLAHF